MPDDAGTHLRGAAGFGYDSIFVPDNEHQTLAAMPPARKNMISHRRPALDERAVVTDLPEIGTALRSIPSLNPKSRTGESSRS